MTQTVHIWSLQNAEPPDRNGSSAAICEGDVATVATETMRACEAHGHTVSIISRTSTLDREIHELTYVVTTELDGREYAWHHVFTKPREPWERSCATS